MSFTWLHVKSHHSIGLGTASIPELLDRAVQYAGPVSLALTDVENLRGQIESHAGCRERGLQAISGVELRRGFQPGKSLGERSGRLVVLASDQRSYAQLCRIVTGRRTAGRCSPDPLSILPSIADGLYLLSDDPVVLEGLVSRLGPRWVRALLVRPGVPSAERQLLRASHELGVGLVADLDATLLHARDAELQALLRAIHLGASLDSQRAAVEGGVLLEGASAERLFADQPEALLGARAIAEACELNLLDQSARASTPLDERLQAACRDALRGTGRDRDARYRRRLGEELAAIEALGLAHLFASVAALVDEARRRAIPLAARGSAVSSLVGHLLGFSPVDPLEQGLYFERFASEARRRPPDIDLDVASRGREQLVTWLLEQHSAGGALRLSALHGFGVRSALREALKAFGSCPHQIEECLRSLPPRELEAPLGALRWPDGARAAQPLLERLIGTPRQLALHPGGVVLGTPEQLALIPLEACSSGPIVSQYDAPSISAIGLCKVDLLGNRCLDELDDTLRARAADGAGRDRDGGDIPMADAATLDRIDAARTIGCHQLESPAMRAVLASLPIRGLSDICHALAIVRPGPAAGSAKEAFLARARGDEPAARVPAELEPRLAATHGMLLYEEDITCVLSTLAGVSLATAEALRVRLVERCEDRAWLARVGERFQRRALERGFERAHVQALWADVLRLGRYSFSRAHSSSQALLAYRAAFLSCHAPVEFGCASLNHHGGSYPRRVIASDLARRGIELRLPSVLRGLAGCELERLPDGRAAIRIGIGLVKGVRSETRRHLLAWQQTAGELPSLGDLIARVHFRPQELEALLWSGALDEIAGLRPGDSPWVHQALWGALSRRESPAWETAVAEARLRIPAKPPRLLARYSGLCRVQGELRYLEMHVSDHPMRLLRGDADQLSCVTSESLDRFVDQVVSFAGIVDATRNVGLAEGGAVQFVTLEDEHGLAEARLSPVAWRRFHPLLATPGPYLLRGLVQRRQGALFLQILELSPFHERAGHLPAPAGGAAPALD